MGCGTGLVGGHLAHKLGSNEIHIDGIDASQGMLDKAASRKIYKELHKTFLCNIEGYKQNFSSLEGKYDFVTASGLLAEGHATSEVFDEMIYSLKQGGYAIFTSRIEYLESLGYQAGLDKLVCDGAWKLVKYVDYEKYSNSKENPVG